MTNEQLEWTLREFVKHGRLGGAGYTTTYDAEGADIRLTALGMRGHSFRIGSYDLRVATTLEMFDRLDREVALFLHLQSDAAPPLALIGVAYSGPLHVHFNRHGAAPLVWSVHPADGRWEVAVKRVVLDGLQMTSVYRPKATPDDEDGKPSAWFEVTGRLELDADGTATIRPL